MRRLPLAEVTCAGGHQGGKRRPRSSAPTALMHSHRSYALIVLLSCKVTVWV